MDQKTDYINLNDVLAALLRHITTIISATLVFAIAGFCLAKFFVTPLYSASAMMIVNSGERYNGYNDYVSTDQLNSAASLVDTYSIIIRSDTVMSDVYSDLGMEKTYKDTVKNVSVSSVNDTQIMRVTVTATDPEIALDVCKEITTVAPDVIVDAVEAGSCKVVENASTTYRPVYPSVRNFTIIGALIGLILSAAFFTIQSLRNNKVSSENDIKPLGLAIIGVIPSYESGEK